MARTGGLPVAPSFSREEFKGLLTSVGGSRVRRLSPVDVGRLLRRERNNGVSVARLTEELGLAPGASVVGWFMRLPDLPDDVQTLVVFGRSGAGLSLTQAAEIARLAPDDEAMRRLAIRAVEASLTGAETRSAVQIVARRGVLVDSAADEVLAGRDITERRHVWICELVPAAASSLPVDASERKARFAATVRAVGVQHLSASAGDHRFTVVLDDAQARAAAQAGLGAESVEKAVNAALTPDPAR